jgi:hypothetical protein
MITAGNLPAYSKKFDIHDFLVDVPDEFDETFGGIWSPA